LSGLAAPVGAFADIILEMGLIEHPDDLVIHQPYVGGQFGRTNDWDHVLYAVYGSTQAGAPVKVIYDRVTDTRVTPYYPAGGIKIRVGVDKAGMPVGWQFNMVSRDMASQQGALGRSTSGAASPTIVPVPDDCRLVRVSAPAFQCSTGPREGAGRFLRGVGAPPLR
jgi:CO/xanthine dehydrogenase Mo-binding subunit